MSELTCHVTAEIFIAYGDQLKKCSPWFPQDRNQEWPNRASALSLGESTIIKYGVTYPLRTGLKPRNDAIDFPEHAEFISFDDPLSVNDKIVEECFLSRGVCVISHGPLGGPSFLKGSYRPLTSYGTGVGISQVTKAKFPKQRAWLDSSLESDDATESYICLAERGGISIYSERSSETHVSHVPEFQIEKILPSKFGLIVVPFRKKKDNVLEYYKNLYILTHPIKQVSKIWIRNRPGHDYCEYDGLEERLIWCQEDLCIFWSLKNDKICVRRLLALEKEEILQLSALNASMCTNTDISSGKLGVHPSSSGIFMHGNSPFAKHPYTRSAAKVNRDGGTLSHWPSLDFLSNSSAAGNSMGHGFYPPHVCIYDDPEVYFKPLFQIDLPKMSWKEPKKFKFMKDSHAKIALWYLIKTNLHAYGININSGIKLSTYSIKNVEDFTIPEGPNKLPVVVILDSNHKLKLGWLDENFCVVCYSLLNLDTPIQFNVSSLNLKTMLFGDTIVCVLKNSEPSSSHTGTISSKVLPPQYVKLCLKNYKDDCLVRNCVEFFQSEFESKILTKLIARLTSGSKSVPKEIKSVASNSKGKRTRKNSDPYSEFQKSWYDFVQSICDVILSEPSTEQLALGKKFLTAIGTYKETFSISNYYASHSKELKYLLSHLSKFLQSKFPKEKINVEIVPLLPLFGYLLVHSKPKSYPKFYSLPEILQLLLDNPDSIRHMERMVEIGKTEKFIPLIELLISDVYHRNSVSMKFASPINVLKATGRNDYLSGRDTSQIIKDTRDFWLEEDENPEVLPTDDLNGDSKWMVPLLQTRIFYEDRRLEEVCRLLDSSHPIYIEVEQRAEMSDHEYVEEQEKHLMQQIQITFSAPIGRTALTLKTDDSESKNLTSSVSIPQLTFAGKCKGKGTTIELSETDLPVAFTNWPHFHNAVGAAIAVRFIEPPADAWFAFNKAKVTDGTEQAGMILGFGLNRILSAMPPTLRHEYLSKENCFTTMSMLLGLSADLAGTGDMATWKLISLHIGAMLPACTTELDIPRLATLVAPCALGLLFLGTQNSYIAKVLLGEISKKFTPLSVFGTSSNNNSTSVANPNENTGTTTDREAHSLCAGLGLGFVNLAKGKVRTSGFADDDFDGILRRFVVGGPKPVHNNGGGDNEDIHNNQEQTLPSMWEEYRCCHIEEGDNVNVDVTTPSAIIAVALTYLRTGNEAVLNWLSPPTTLHLLDGVRPDLLMLRSLASVLVFEKLRCPSVTWLENNLMPKTLLQYALQEPEGITRLNSESINQCWASIVCGYCMGLGIRYAGTSDNTVKKSIRHYIDLFIKLSSKESSKLCEYLPKNFLESCICNLVLASSLVVAGTGDISMLRICRYLQKKVSLSTVTVSSNSYGLEMCISMATGILFLGGGRYSLSNDDKSIAMLVASVFPKWPINANDNRYHLQALRHLYVLAAQPRLILPKPMPRGSQLIFNIEFIDGSTTSTPAPVLLPPFYLLKKIKMEHDEFFSIEFELPKDLPYLHRIVENRGELKLVPKPIGLSNYGFVREMSWRQDSNFHSTFAIDDLTPIKERNKIKEFNLIHQLAEWSGMKQIVAPVLALLFLNQKDRKDENLDWQIRILHWWVENSRIKKRPTCFTDDLLNLLRTPQGKDPIDITKPSSVPRYSVSDCLFEQTK